MGDSMNYREFIQREAEGFARRGLGSATDIDDILMADELRRLGELRRKVDDADGFNAIEDGED